jgi:hypothetical protein
LLGDVYTVAKECGLQPEQLGRWRSDMSPCHVGHSSCCRSVAIPLCQPLLGRGRGFRVSDDGQLLECPATRVRLRYEDVAMMPEYRSAHRLVQEQAELIER